MSEIIHRCPLLGSSTLPCCGWHAFEHRDARITVGDDAVTCGQWPLIARAERIIEDADEMVVQDDGTRSDEISPLLAARALLAAGLLASPDRLLPEGASTGDVHYVIRHLLTDPSSALGAACDRIRSAFEAAVPESES